MVSADLSGRQDTVSWAENHHSLAFQLAQVLAALLVSSRRWWGAFELTGDVMFVLVWDGRRYADVATAMQAVSCRIRAEPRALELQVPRLVGEAIDGKADDASRRVVAEQALRSLLSRDRVG